jgi:hypothetical protein
MRVRWTGSQRSTARTTMSRSIRPGVPMGAPEYIVYVVDDDVRMREAVGELFASLEVPSVTFASVAEYVAYTKPELPACLILDVKLPDIAAKVIADVTGRPVKHNDIDRDVWIQGSVAAGVPAEYGQMLRMLTETIASGMGSRPNDNVETVTGAPPIKFADFARRTAQAWT